MSTKAAVKKRLGGARRRRTISYGAKENASADKKASPAPTKPKKKVKAVKNTPEKKVESVEEESSHASSEEAAASPAEEDRPSKAKTVSPGKRARAPKASKKAVAVAKKKVGAGKEASAKTKKAKKAATGPKRPLSAYMMFCQAKRAELGLKGGKEAMSKLGALWKELGDDAQGEWKSKASAALAQFKKDHPEAAATKKAKKAATGPKRPLGAYMMFCQAKRAELGLKGGKEAMSKLGALWKELGDDAQGEWKSKASAALAQFKKDHPEAAAPKRKSATGGKGKKTKAKAKKKKASASRKRASPDFVSMKLSPRPVRKRPSPKKRLRFQRAVGLTGMNSSERSFVTATATKALNFAIDDDITMVSHLVLGGPTRTLKLMQAIARGMWIVKPAWIYACLSAASNDVHEEEEEEAQGDDVDEQAEEEAATKQDGDEPQPMRAEASSAPAPALEPLEKGDDGLVPPNDFEAHDWFPGVRVSREKGGELFIGKTVAFVGRNHEFRPPKRELVHLLELAGGKVRQSAADADYVVSPTPDPTEDQVNSDWLLDSITEYNLKPFADYSEAKVIDEDDVNSDDILSDEEVDDESGEDVSDADEEGEAFEMEDEDGEEEEGEGEDEE